MKLETTEIASDQIVHKEKGKKFYFDLCENERGTYLRIREVSRHGKSGMVIIPADILLDVIDILEDFNTRITVAE